MVLREHAAHRLRRASLHTKYVDRPMRGHGPIQAIARVNRVFKDKPGGLVGDYTGLAHELERAVATYTDRRGLPALPLSRDRSSGRARLHSAER